MVSIRREKETKRGKAETRTCLVYLIRALIISTATCDIWKLTELVRGKPCRKSNYIYNIIFINFKRQEGRKLRKRERERQDKWNQTRIGKTRTTRSRRRSRRRRSRRGRGKKNEEKRKEVAGADFCNESIQVRRLSRFYERHCIYWSAPFWLAERNPFRTRRAMETTLSERLREFSLPQETTTKKCKKTQTKREKQEDRLTIWHFSARISTSSSAKETVLTDGGPNEIRSGAISQVPSSGNHILHAVLNPSLALHHFI